MREYWILTRLQLSSLFGVNKLRHARTDEEKRKRKRNVLMLALMVYALINVSVTYSYLLAEALEPMGALPDLLGIMSFAAAGVLTVLTMFSAKNVLFGFGDYDTVMSWPVRVSAVAAGRVTAMYAYNLVYGLLFLLPAGVIYAIKASPDWWYYPLYLLLSVLFPLLPTVLGAAVGTLITLATAGFRKNNLLNAGVQMLLLFGVMFFSFRMSGNIENIGEKAAGLQNLVRGVYPPAVWFENGLTAGSPAGILLTALSGVGALALFALLLSRGFVRLNTRLAAAPRGKARCRVDGLRRSSAVRALYRKEWKRYLSSTIYVSNTAFGYVLLLALAVVLGLVKPPAVQQVLDAPEMAALKKCLPFALAWLVCMSATTGSAVSMEGKQLWIVKSLPVRAKDWLLSKALVSLTLAVPSLLVAVPLIAIGQSLSAEETAYLLLTPLAYALFSAVAGLWLNLRLPKLDWKSDVEVVKQSMCVGLFVFGSMGLTVLPAVALALTGMAWVLPGATGLILALTGAIYWNLCSTADGRLYRL